jgi:hypothetical protein
MNRSMRRRIASVGVVASGAIAWLLWRFPPASSRFYPRCPVYETFHIYCPGCGGTRAVSALLHGRLMDALHSNPLVVLLLPLVLAFVAVAWFRAIRDTEFRWPDVPGIWVKAALAAAIAFMVIRNFPQGR